MECARTGCRSCRKPKVVEARLFEGDFDMSVSNFGQSMERMMSLTVKIETDRSRGKKRRNRCDIPLCRKA